jgi:hypothetical protein
MMAMLPNIGVFQGQNHGSWSDDRSKSSKVDVRCGFAEQQPVCHIRLHEASYFFLLLFHDVLLSFRGHYTCQREAWC